MIRRSFAVLGAASVLLAASGCIKEKITLTIYPDGSGKIAVTEAVNGAMAAMGQMGGDNGNKNKKETAEKMIYKTLSEYEGVVAWKDVKAEVTDEGEIKGEGVGYFEDVTKLARTGDNDQTITWTKTDAGGFTFEMKTNMKKKGDKDPADDFLKKDLTDEQVQMQLGMIQGILGGLKFEYKVVMPGDVSDVTGPQAKEGRNATYTLTGKDLGDTIKKCFDKGMELRKKIDAGDKTEDEARAEIDKEMGKALGRIKVTCGKGDFDAESKENKKAMDAAKKDYKGSELEEKIKKAHEEKLTLPGAPGGGNKKKDDDE